MIPINLAYASKSRGGRPPGGGVGRIPSTFHSRQHGILTQPLLALLRGSDANSREFARLHFTQRWDLEDIFQIHLLNTLYAITRNDFEAIHIPNGGHRAKSTASDMKRLGTRAGVFDLFCGWEGGTGWLECKSKSGSLKKAQNEFGAWLNRTGQKWRRVSTISASVAALVEMGAPVIADFKPIANLAPR